MWYDNGNQMNVNQMTDAAEVFVETLSFRFLTVEENGYTELLGYPLAVTPTQVRILRALLQTAPEAIAADRLSAECLHTQGNGQVPVQIHAINRAAMEISGRKLILNRRGVGYYLNTWM